MTLAAILQEKCIFLKNEIILDRIPKDIFACGLLRNIETESEESYLD